MIRILIAISLFISPAIAQDGQHGVGHETWHDSFYSGLVRPQYNTSCCSSADCRPTQSRQVGDHYEVMVDGAWVRVPPEIILHVTAPDWGAHVCAPIQRGANKGALYCVVLPPEG